MGVDVWVCNRACCHPINSGRQSQHLSVHIPIWVGIRLAGVSGWLVITREGKGTRKVKAQEYYVFIFPSHTLRLRYVVAAAVYSKNGRSIYVWWYYDMVVGLPIVGNARSSNRLCALVKAQPYTAVRSFFTIRGTAIRSFWFGEWIPGGIVRREQNKGAATHWRIYIYIHLRFVCAYLNRYLS